MDFRWILPGRLAGCSQPGLWRPVTLDLAVLEDLDIRLLVTLTEQPLDPPAGSSGITRLHFPIADMGIPTPRDTWTICRQILASLDRGEAVAVHCKAGLGRTGTILACCLVTLGRAPDQAVLELRRIAPGYIQTEAQEQFVHHYAEFLDNLTPPPPAA